MKGKGPLDRRLPPTGPAAQKLVLDRDAGQSHDDNSYLVQLVDQAQIDGGISCRSPARPAWPKPGRRSTPASAGWTSWPGRPWRPGNLDNAERSGRRRLRRDPNDPKALGVKDGVAKRRQRRRRPHGGGGAGWRRAGCPAPGRRGGDLNLGRRRRGAAARAAAADGGLPSAVGRKPRSSTR